MIEDLTHNELLTIRLALEAKRLQLTRKTHDGLVEHGHSESRTVDLLIQKARLENLRATLQQRQGFEQALTTRRSGFTRTL